jgi:hypothetical protein
VGGLHENAHNRAVVRTLTNGVGPLHHQGILGASRPGGENVSDSCRPRGMKPLCGALNVTPREAYAVTNLSQIGRRCHTIALI